MPHHHPYRKLMLLSLVRENIILTGTILWMEQWILYAPAAPKWGICQRLETNCQTPVKYLGVRGTERA